MAASSSGGGGGSGGSSEKVTYGDTVCLTFPELNGFLSGSGLVDERLRCEPLEKGVLVPPNLDTCRFEVCTHSTLVHPDLTTRLQLQRSQRLT